MDQSRAILWALAPVLSLFTWHVSSGCCTRTAVGHTGLNVAVKDRATDALICDAQIVFRDGEWSEEPVAAPNPLADNCPYRGAYERPGSYSITITRRGFLTKTIDDVEVDESVCGGIEPRSLEVHLERDSQASPEDFLPIDAGAEAATDAGSSD